MDDATDLQGDAVVRCAWCGRPFQRSAGPGRPRRYCRRACRQRDFEARRRAAALGLAEDELVLRRGELSHVDDLVYVLACAVEDVERDLADSQEPAEVRRSLDWLLEAARPLVELSRSGRLGRPTGG